MKVTQSEINMTKAAAEDVEKLTDAEAAKHAEAILRNLDGEELDEYGLNFWEAAKAYFTR